MFQLVGLAFYMIVSLIETFGEFIVVGGFVWGAYETIR